MILFLGDTHGDRLLFRVLEKAHKQGITDVIQTGDFGIHWPTGRPCPYYQYFQKRDVIKPRPGPRVYTCGGNHDAYHKIEELIERGQCDGNQVYYTPRCSFVHRGSILNIQGLNIMFLGGAESSDCNPTIPNEWEVTGGHPGRAQYPEPWKTKRAQAKRQYRAAPGAWWEQESITAEDIQRAETTLRKQSADIWVTHDGPTRARPHRVGGYATPSGVIVGNSAVLLDELYERTKIKPTHWFYGHHHKDTRLLDTATRFYCCGIVETNWHLHNRTAVNGYVLDPKTWMVQAWSVHG